MTTEFDPLQLAKDSPTFCIHPWMQQYIGTAGDIKPCCVYLHSSELGNLKDNSLKEIWNNDATKALRLKFLKGEQDNNCRHCNDKSRLSTTRTTANQIFFNKFEKEVASTLPDGSVPEHKLYYMDVRFNNLCNFSCRTCSPHFSTNWVLDNRKLYNLSSKQEINDGFQFPGNYPGHAFDEMKPHMGHLHTIYFAGGEPLIQQEHYDTLQHMIEIGHTCGIVYNTNLSKLNLGDRDVTDYWNKFPRVFVSASIDGSHAKAEYWRHGTDWTEIVENVKKINEKCKTVELGISFTLSWVNAINAVELHREWIELGYIKPEKFSFNIIGVSQYSLQNIPLWKKEQIKKLYNEHIAWLLSRYNKDRIQPVIDSFLEAINFMESQSNTDGLHYNLKEFSRFTKKLDEIRNENFFETFPEHQDINEYMTTHNLHDTFDY